MKITLVGGRTVSPRTAELKDVFSATAFSARRLVTLQCSCYQKDINIFKYKNYSTKSVLSDLAKLLLVPTHAPLRYICTFGQREGLVFVWVLGLCCLPANLRKMVGVNCF